MSEEPYVTKAEFCEQQHISPRTVDLWVKAGKVEKIKDLDRKPYFRMAQTSNAVTPVTHSEPPPWAVELLTEIQALRAEIALLKAPEKPTPLLRSESNAVTPATQPARVPWWRRIFLGEGVVE